MLQKIEKPFLAAVESTLGDRYTPNVENIYKITIKFILQTLVDGYEKSAKASSATANSTWAGLCAEMIHIQYLCGRVWRNTPAIWMLGLIRGRQYFKQLFGMKIVTCSCNKKSNFISQACNMCKTMWVVFWAEMIYI